MRLWNLGACVLALVVVACGGEGVTGEPREAGTLRLPLVSTSVDGTAYKLVGATFTITGPQTVTITDTSADTVVTTLQAGSYTVELVGPWTMERVDAPGTAVPVQLLSPNPLPLVVTKEETSQVRFQFKYAGDGSAQVGIGVDSGGWLAGTIQFTELYYPTTEPTAFDELVGKSVPFLLSFETASVLKDPSWDKALRVSIPTVSFQFGGTPSALLQRAAADLSGVPYGFDLVARPGGFMDFYSPLLMGRTNEFEFQVHGAMSPFPGEFDNDGYPARRPFQFDTTVVLRNSMNGVRGTVTINGSP